MSLTIDGSLLEGGGQILRNVISLCCLTHTDVQIDNIRKKRSKPGLRPQHLNGLQLVGRLCSASVKGDTVDSSSVCFCPDKIQNGKYYADTKTAGSISLLMQVAVPCLCFAHGPSSLSLKGGTDAEMAPPVDYYTKIFLPIAARFGIDVHCNLIRRGFYPQGKGEMVVDINPVKELQPVNMIEFGRVKRITGTAFIAGSLPTKVAHKMASSAVGFITETLGMTPDIRTLREQEDKAFATGSGILIIAETTTGCLLAGSAVGKKGKPAEEVGAEAAKMLCEDLRREVCVDQYLQDQLILLMALANGISTVKTGPISLHTRTAIYIAETLTKAIFQIETFGDSEEQNIITCKGIGYQAS